MNIIEYSEQTKELIKQRKYDVLEKYRQTKKMTHQEVFHTEPHDIIELMKELTDTTPTNELVRESFFVLVYMYNYSNPVLPIVLKLIKNEATESIEQLQNIVKMCNENYAHFNNVLMKEWLEDYRDPYLKYIDFKMSTCLYYAILGAVANARLSGDTTNFFPRELLN